MFSEILGNVRKRSRMLVETLPMNHLLAQLQIVAEIHSIEDDRQLSTEIPLYFPLYALFIITFVIH